MTQVILALALVAGEPDAAPLPLPGADGPVGFDDLRFSAELHKVIVPAGRTGRIALIDPRDETIDVIAGFSASPGLRRGHGDGTTSADSGHGLLFASDRTRRELVIADPTTKRIVARTRLTGTPDYVRWVEATREVWVTEPGREVIETFRVDETSSPTLMRTGTIDVPDGPEALEIDPGRRRAYTNTWHDGTIAIDITSRTIRARWNNGCGGSRGLALDALRGFLFVGCDEGSAVTLDVAHEGRVVGRARAGAGVDVIAFSAALSHLYIPAGDAATVTVMKVANGGSLTVLGEVATVRGAHCATADDRGNLYVCDPEHGRLLTLQDRFPSSSRGRGARTGR